MHVGSIYRIIYIYDILYQQIKPWNDEGCIGALSQLFKGVVSVFSSDPPKIAKPDSQRYP